MASSNTNPAYNTNHAEKPENFKGNDFKRWQQKMYFDLITLNLSNCLNEEPPKINKDETDCEKVAAVDDWKHFDYLCRNYILNGFHDSIYIAYSNVKMANELWVASENKYKPKMPEWRNSLSAGFLILKWWTISS